MRHFDGRDIAPDKRKRLLGLQKDLRSRLKTKLPPDALLFECKQCRQIYLVNDFDLVDRSRYGIRPVCRKCKKAKRKQYPPQMDGVKTCKMCREEKSIMDFSTDKARITGRSSNCRQCVKTAIQKRRLSTTGVVDDAVLEFRRRQTLNLVIEEGLGKVPDYDLKRCSRCKSVKPLAHFYICRYSADRRLSRCDVCDERGKNRGKNASKENQET